MHLFFCWLSEIHRIANSVCARLAILAAAAVVSEPLAASHTTAQPQPVIWGQASMMLAICLVLRFFFFRIAFWVSLKIHEYKMILASIYCRTGKYAFSMGGGSDLAFCVCVWHFAVICGVCCTTFHVHSSGWFDVLSFGSSFWLSRSSALSVCVCVWLMPMADFTRATCSLSLRSHVYTLGLICLTLDRGF